MTRRIHLKGSIRALDLEKMACEVCYLANTTENNTAVELSGWTFGVTVISFSFSLACFPGTLCRSCLVERNKEFNDANASGAWRRSDARRKRRKMASTLIYISGLKGWRTDDFGVDLSEVEIL